MKRIIRRLKTKLLRRAAWTEADTLDGPKRLKPEGDDSRVELPFRKEARAQDVLMPDMNSDEYVATVPNLEILDESSLVPDKSTGFNPYDTAVLKKR